VGIKEESIVLGIIGVVHDDVIPKTIIKPLLVAFAFWMVKRVIRRKTIFLKGVNGSRETLTSGVNLGTRKALPFVRRSSEASVQHLCDGANVATEVIEAINARLLDIFVGWKTGRCRCGLRYGFLRYEEQETR